MRNKDSMLLENCYNKVKNPLLKEQVEDMEFVSQIDVDYIGSDSPEVKQLDDLSVQDRAVGSNDAKQKVTLKYKIELEYRKYGIKDISFYGFKLEPFVFTVMDEEFEEKVIKEMPALDLTEAKYEYGSDGRSFQPLKIRLFVDKNLNIIPANCTIEF